MLVPPLAADLGGGPTVRLAHVRETGRSRRYYVFISKVWVEIDRELAAQAAAILGTSTLRDTIDASLRQVVDFEHRLELVSLLGDRYRYDMDAAEAAWGGGD